MNNIIEIGRGGSADSDNANNPSDSSLAQQPERNIIEYDFKHPKLVSKEIMRTLRKIHEQFARNLKRLYGTILNQKFEVTLEEIEQVVFSEYLNSLEPPTAIFLFNIEELGDWAILQKDPSFCLYFIEKLCGGQVSEFQAPRSLTRIEEGVFSRIMKKVFKELSHVWSTYLKMTIQHHVYESKPTNIRAISAGVPGITVRYTVRFDDEKIPFSICYPYGLLKEQMISSLNGFDKHDTKVAMTPAQKVRFREDLKKVDVTLRPILGKTKIKMERLTQLSVGDVIALDQPIDEPLEILSNQTLELYGYPGTLKGKRAVKVFKIVQ